MAIFLNIFKNYFIDVIPFYIWMGTNIENKNYEWSVGVLRQVKHHSRFLCIKFLLVHWVKLNRSNIDLVVIGSKNGDSFRHVEKNRL